MLLNVAVECYKSLSYAVDNCLSNDDCVENKREDHQKDLCL